MRYHHSNHRYEYDEERPIKKIFKKKKKSNTSKVCSIIGLLILIMTISAVLLVSFQKKFGFVDILKLLTHEKAVVLPDNPTTKHLFDAIRDNNVPLASGLIEYGVDLEEFNDSGYNTLHYAASMMNVEVMKLILETGRVDIEATTKDGDENIMTALHIVASNADKSKSGDIVIEAARLLLEHNADIESVGAQGYTPLLAGAEFSVHPELIKFLLENNADIDVKSSPYYYTPLHAAMDNCNKDILKVLIAFGADVDALNKINRRPIHEAAFFGCVAGVEQLLLTKKVGIDDATPVKLTFVPIPDSDSTLYFGATPLHFAAIGGKLNVVQALMARYASPVVYDANNKSALNYAEDGMNPDVLNYLREKI